uniref:Major sperm protein n=1 Tax=Trichuris muris TaxID=70415 RepID=A0A5S6QAC7_TRIMR
MGKEKEKETEDRNIIQVYPEELIITGTYFHQRLKYVTLKNWSPYRVGYKVKSSHPDNYTIKPTTGVMESNESVLIRVLLYRYTNKTFNEKHYLSLFALTIDQKEAADEAVLEHLEDATEPAYVKLPIRFKSDNNEQPSPLDDSTQVKKLSSHLLAKFGDSKKSKSLKGKEAQKDEESLTPDGQMGKPIAENGAQQSTEEQIAKELEHLRQIENDPALQTGANKKQGDENEEPAETTFSDYFNNVLSQPDTFFWMTCALLFLIILTR